MSYVALRVTTRRYEFGRLRLVTDYWEEHLSRLRGRDLANLRLHWDEFYKFSWDKRFRGVRLDDGTALEADTAVELWELLRIDYSEHPVRRPS
jgi:hypothetical protein